MHIDYNAGHEKSTDWICRCVNFGIVGMWGKIRLGATGRVVPARLSILLINAGMAKLVDALDLGSSGATHRSSSLLTRTKYKTV